MKNDTSPSEMLESLAGRVATEMDQRAVASFTRSLKELTEFHKFLIDAYLTKDHADAIASFAQLGDWRAQHRTWLSLYDPLFVRAINYISKDNEFIKSLAYAPAALLPREGRKAAPEVTSGILDLYTILTHRLEKWLTQRRVLRDDDETPDAPPGIAGSHKQAYEDVIVGVVSAWEHLLDRGTFTYGWRRDNAPGDEMWRRFQASRAFTQQHIHNSAYMLATAVWNEDETGADYFSEVLVKWADRIDYVLDTQVFINQSLITPDVLELSWQVAIERLSAMGASPQWHQPTPEEVFKVIAYNMVSDVKIIAAGLLLAWTTENQQQTDIGARNAAQLLHQTPLNGHATDTPPAIAFSDLMVQQLRLKTSGERHEPAPYANWLDEHVRLLDMMTERRVVPGRVYRSTTRRSREDLMTSWLAILAARAPQDGDEGAAAIILTLTENERAFAGGDETLRRWIEQLNRWKSTIDADDRSALLRALQALAPDIDGEAQLRRLGSCINEIIDGVEQQRPAG